MTHTRDTSQPPRHGIGYWLTMALALVLILFGLPIFAGGLWLIVLNFTHGPVTIGSFYYAIAGAGLLLTAALMLAGKITAIWVYVATWIFTLVWAFWEVGLDGWALVPRLVAPTLILLLVLATIPVLRRGHGLIRPRRTLRHPLVAGMTVVIGASFALLLASGPAQAKQGEAPQGQIQEGSQEGQAAPPPEIEENTVQPERTARAMATAGADWPAYGGSKHATRYSPLDQITPENVGQLTRVWEYRSGDMPRPEAEGKYSPENTPLKVGDDLFHCTAMGIVIAIDAATGLEEWRFDPEVSEDAIPYGATCRGVAYYDDPDAAPDELCARRIVWGTLDARLIAVDAELGQPCIGFGEGGEVNLERGIGDTVPGWYSVTAPPVIVRGVVVTGAQVQDGQAEDSPSGVIRGYDAVTGEFTWAWDLGNPGDHDQPAEGEVYTRGTPNMWTMAAADEELGYVYLPLGNSAVDYYGSNRSELENEFSTSLVALDATTGEEVWHFQTVHNDVWDYDLGSQPTLVDFPQGDETVPAIIVSSKQGEIYVLDRETGESLFPVEEREVPSGGVEPDYLSPTQPFSGYHSLAMEPLEEKDMWGVTPLDQLWCRIQFRLSNYDGIYQPPTTTGRWIQYPGYNGGQDWGSMAVAEDRGILIANYNDMPNHNRLVPREESDARPINAADGPAGEAGPQIGSPYAIAINAGWRVGLTGMMCKQPPYGGIRAIDLETGETLWDEPLGTARANGPFGIPSRLPLTIGTPNNGGPLITAGGVIFIAATTDNLIRAIDIETGEVLWEDVLPAGGQATPISYEADGRQFIAFAPGGHHFMETPVGDYVLAWALPE